MREYNTDSINGKSFSLICSKGSTRQIPVEAKTPMFQVSRLLKKALTRLRCSYFFGVNEEDGSKTWWLSKKRGHSFLATLEQWVAERMREDSSYGSSVIVIPADRQVYYAEFDDGFLKKEGFLPFGEFSSEVVDWGRQGVTIYAYAGGKQTDSVSEIVSVEERPEGLNLFEFEYKHYLLSFLLNRLFHPSQAIAVISIFILGYLLIPVGSDSMSMAERALEYKKAYEERLSVEKTVYGSFLKDAEILVNAVKFVDPEFLELGVQSVIFESSGRELIVSGSVEEGDYPRTLFKLSAEQGLLPKVTPQGWSAKRFFEKEKDTKKVGLGTNQLSLELYDIVDEAGGVLTNVSLREYTEVIGVDYLLTMEKPTIYDIEKIAAKLETYPIEPKVMKCVFLKNWSIENCQFSFLAKSIKDN